MALKKDKEKVIGETWDDARVKSFLEVHPPADENPDHFILLKAYRSMREGDFARFVVFFKEAGRDLQAQNSAGQTVLDIVRQHRHGEAYAQAIEDALS